MHNHFTSGPLRAAALAAGLLGTAPGAHAQASDQLLFVGSGAGTGVGRYNPTGFFTGLTLRFQQPLGAGFSITGHTGGDFFLIKKAFRPYYYYDYYSGYYYSSYGPGAGFSIPVTVGPRYYIVNGWHVDLNLGVDIGVTERAATAFRFEPGVGCAVPLANHGYVDLGTSFVTSFGTGSGVFSFNFAYGLRFGGKRAAPAPAAPTYGPAHPFCPGPAAARRAGRISKVFRPADFLRPPPAVGARAAGPPRGSSGNARFPSGRGIQR